MESYKIIDGVLHVFTDTGVHDYCEENGIAREDFNQPIVISDDIESCSYMLSGCASFNQPLTIPLCEQKQYGGMLHNCASFNSTITWSKDFASYGDIYTVQMFEGCISLQSITLPECHLGFAESMFSGCHALVKADCHNISVEDAICMFSDCSELVEVDLPYSLVEGGQMFVNCEKLTTVRGWNDVQVAERMFKGCTSLKHVQQGKLAVPIPWCSWGMFEGCENLGELQFVADGDAFDEALHLLARDYDDEYDAEAGTFFNIPFGDYRDAEEFCTDDLKILTANAFELIFKDLPGTFDKNTLTYKPPVKSESSTDITATTNLFN